MTTVGRMRRGQVSGFGVQVSAKPQANKTAGLINKETIKEELLYLTEETKGLQVMIIDGQAVALEIPQSVEMVIEETSPSIKGASASARTKPATFITGLVVQVPEYLSAGERVKINTSDKRFMGRAN